MIAYKGFTKDLWSRLGDGKEENCKFTLGETKTVSESKTVRSGFHCCENPFDCLTYYPMNGDNRFFKVEATGDIDEDDSQRIACTSIKLIEELSPVKFAVEGVKYMVMHPHRENWQQFHETVQVKKNTCEAYAADDIAIARGINPMVKGPKGSLLGLLVENKDGDIVNAKIIKVGDRKANKWLYLTDERQVKEIEES